MQQRAGEHEREWLWSTVACAKFCWRLHLSNSRSQIRSTTSASVPYVRRTVGLDRPAPFQLKLLITGPVSVCTSSCTSCAVPAGPRTAHAQGNLSGQSAWQFAGGRILRRSPPPLLRPPQVGGPWGSLRGAAEMVQPLQCVAPVTGPGSLPFALHHCPQRLQAASLPCGRSWKRRGGSSGEHGRLQGPPAAWRCPDLCCTSFWRLL